MTIKGRAKSALIHRALGTVVWLLLLFAGATGLHAGWIEDCPDGTTVIHIKLWDMPDASRTDPASRAKVAVVQEFVRRFPTIFAQRYAAKYKADPATYGRHNWDAVTVELHKFSGISVESVQTDLLAIAGQVSPDIIYVKFSKSDTYIQAGFLYPLDEWLAARTEEDVAFRINPKIWPVIKRKGPNGAVHVWAMPYDGTKGKALLYRKDLFDAHGIPYPDKDWTWEDQYEAVVKIANPAEGVYGYLTSRGMYESWFWGTFLWSAGGEVMEYNEETDQWRTIFDSRAAAVALDAYTRLG